MSDFLPQERSDLPISSGLKDLEVIGLIPSAGRATRLAPIPVSKAIYPIGFRTTADGTFRPKVVSHYLLENMRQASIRKAFFLLRPGKWDIPEYYGSGDWLDMNLGYLVVNRLDGVQHSLNQAYPFVREAIVALGYPDILLQPGDSYTYLLKRLYEGRADIVIGAVPFPVPQKGGMITFDPQNHNRVSLILNQPEQSDERYSWCSAVWKPSFSQFLHDYLAHLDRTDPEAATQESPVGDMMQIAIHHGLCVEAELFDEGSFLDVGTPSDLAKAILTHTQPI